VDFKALADKKKELFDGDIEALVLRTDGATAGPWFFESLSTQASTGQAASASIRLRHTDGRITDQQASGDGPVDATFKAIEIATGVTVKLHSFEVRGVTQGEDAQGEAIVNVIHNERSYRGSSVTTNIVESSAHAFIEVINRILTTRQSTPSTHPQLSSDRAAVEATV
jgi:2-isopropylmalate synthase